MILNATDKNPETPEKNNYIQFMLFPFFCNTTDTDLRSFTFEQCF